MQNNPPTEGFHQHWQHLSWNTISAQINSKTARDVEHALCASKINLTDLMALLSPAALPYLEHLAVQAQQLTRQRFGNTVNFFIPLYLSNLCTNTCTYCGFSMDNRIKRRTLNKDSIIRECEAVKALGFKQVLLVTGEHQTKVGMAYFRQHLSDIRSHFNYLMMEVQPLTQDDYVELKKLGIDGVMVYQETYDITTWHQYHLRGAKQNFFWRLNTADRLGRAGMNKIGLGALIGLSAHWRTDYYILAEHLHYLQKNWWKSSYCISFPRLRPCTGGITPACVITDAQLVQLICAFRLFAPDVELSLSTRESPSFRDNIVPIAINNISAGSRTQPGGYASQYSELEQFSIHDTRSPEQVAVAMIKAGLQPVWKDWDIWLGRA